MNEIARIAKIAKDRGNWAIDQFALKSSILGNDGNFGNCEIPTGIQPKPNGGPVQRFERKSWLV
jgi:hypothetical protein